MGSTESSDNYVSSRRRPTWAVGVLAVVALAGLGASCSSDDLADTVAEKAAEAGSGEDVDVSIDSESGEFSVEGADGESSFSVGSSELPDAWPEEVPLPDDYSLTSAIESSASGSESFSLTGTVPGDGAEIFDELTAELAADGWDELQKGTTSMGEGTSSSASFDNGTWQVLIGMMSGDGSDDTFSYTVVASTE